MARESSNVLILGYGEMGRAMQTLLQPHHNVHIWNRHPPEGIAPVSLNEIAPLADFVVFCLPVNPHREIATRLVPMLKSGSVCISIAKGLDESGQTAAQIFADVLGAAHIDYALLYGPMISEELRAGRRGFAQLGCSNTSMGDAVRHLFACSTLRVETCADIPGISWSVILKNAYAPLFGMADELGLGDNVRGFLMVQAMHELDAIVRLMGGAPGSPFHLAGLGDLVTTVTSEDSHHHMLGRKLVHGDASGFRCEGVHTLQMVEKHGIFPWRDFPLFSLVHSIVLDRQDPASRIAEFMNTPL